MPNSPGNAKTAHQAQLVGRKIRQLRKERKLTQTALAARIGIQQSDLSRMEKGEYRVSLDTLFRILAEFDVSLAEFFQEDDAEVYSPKDMMFVRQFNSLPQDAQDEVRAFIAFKNTTGRDTGGKPPRS
ncbi:MAG: helix-turn-helix transcriptional regulator [Acidobacteria bacterium]|nr:helix-turn-helix transcriptional regulator [Acidobacteriota bacterium]